MLRGKPWRIKWRRGQQKGFGERIVAFHLHKGSGAVRRGAEESDRRNMRDKDGTDDILEGTGE